MVYTKSQLLTHPLTDFYMQKVWQKFTAGQFRGDLIFLFAHLISWFLYITFRHAAGSLLGESLANLASLVMLLIVIMSFIAIVFRSHKMKTVFKSRWEVYSKVVSRSDFFENSKFSENSSKTEQRRKSTKRCAYWQRSHSKRNFQSYRARKANTRNAKWNLVCDNYCLCLDTQDRFSFSA